MASGRTGTAATSGIPGDVRGIRPPRLRRLVDGIVVLLVLVAVAGCIAAAPTPSIIMLSPNGTQAPMGVRDTAYNPPRPAPALQLTDQDGQPFDLASLRGTAVFVYFGYTHCPDVCPTTLADLRAAIQTASLPAKVVFVTVDPARDTPQKMKLYLGAYKAGFIGLTGSADQIAAAASAWGVQYQAGPADSRTGYPMSHTTDTYLVDAGGTLRHHIFFGAQSALIADLLRKVSDA